MPYFYEKESNEEDFLGGKGGGKVFVLKKLFEKD